MSMTFLQLVNRARQECGVTGAEVTSLASLNEENQRIKDWVSQEWIEIQNRHANWEFRRAAVSFTTTTNQRSYTPAQAGITSFAKWKDDEPFRYYVTASGTDGEQWLSWMDYESYRNFYLFGTERSTYNTPVDIAIGPDKSLYLGPGPDSTGYTIIGECYTSAQELSADGDVPDLPSRFHMIIVYAVKKRYGLFEVAAEMIQAGRIGFSRLITDLENDQLPRIEVGGPLT